MNEARKDSDDGRICPLGLVDAPGVLDGEERLGKQFVAAELVNHCQGGNAGYAARTDIEADRTDDPRNCYLRLAICGNGRLKNVDQLGLSPPEIDLAEDPG